jgi:hypothetical protein
LEERGMAQHFDSVDEYITQFPAGDEAFQADIAPFRAAKGTLKFPLGKPLP